MAFDVTIDNGGSLAISRNTLRISALFDNRDGRHEDRVINEIRNVRKSYRKKDRCNLRNIRNSDLFFFNELHDAVKIRNQRFQIPHRIGSQLLCKNFKWRSWWSIFSALNINARLEFLLKWRSQVTDNNDRFTNDESLSAKLLFTYQEQKFQDSSIFNSNFVTKSSPKKTNWTLGPSHIDNHGTHLPGFPCQLADVVSLSIASLALLRGIRALATLVRRQFRWQVGIGVGQDVATFSPVILIQLAIEVRHPRMNEPI